MQRMLVLFVMTFLMTSACSDDKGSQSPQPDAGPQADLGSDTMPDMGEIADPCPERRLDGPCKRAEEHEGAGRGLKGWGEGW